MRFDKIELFEVEELVLDEGNYRFRKAEDQFACIKKIYMTNPPYFRGLMKSIAENDLGEPLLVYHNLGENIVSDGNRRLSAMKVLYDDKYSPSDSLIEYAKKLRSENNINFSNIQGQVSDNKSLISRTVFERHSGGKNGTSRIPWNAYAAARFGYDELIGDSKEWYIMALLSKTEEEHPEIESFLDSHDFSYEVFRRLIRAAFKKKRISEIIFSERGERIKKTARADLIQDAVEKAYSFLLAIQNKEITLSRKDGGQYADKDTVDLFIDAYSLSPDNKELEDVKKGKDNQKSEDNVEGQGGPQDPSEGESNNASESGEEDGGKNSGSSEANSTTSSEYGVGESKKITHQLNSLSSRKLSGLYNSLCKVSLNQHPALMYVGAWSFLEVLSKCAGNTTQDFPAYFKGKYLHYGIEKQVGKDCSQALDEISKYGNATKHSKNATPMSAMQLKNNFEVLEPLILAALTEAIHIKQ